MRAHGRSEVSRNIARSTLQTCLLGVHRRDPADNASMLPPRGVSRGVSGVDARQEAEEHVEPKPSPPWLPQQERSRHAAVALSLAHCPDATSYPSAVADEGEYQHWLWQWIETRLRPLSLGTGRSTVPN